jgi:hypothetical protein
MECGPAIETETNNPNPYKAEELMGHVLTEALEIDSAFGNPIYIPSNFESSSESESDHD